MEVQPKQQSSIDAEEILTLDHDADIFQFNGAIYETNINCVKVIILRKTEDICVKV